MRQAAFIVTPQDILISPASSGTNVIQNAIQPLPTGISELGIHRASGTFLMGSVAGGTNAAHLELCGSQFRLTRGILEILAVRLDTGESDYCRLRFNLPPRSDLSPYTLGSLAAAMSIGDTSAVITPGTNSAGVLLPGVGVTIGGNTLVVQSYDSGSMTLTFYTPATAAATSGTGIYGQADVAIIDDFATSDIFYSPFANGAAIDMQTTAYTDGADPAVPIAVTFWSTDTLFFDGSYLNTL